MTTRLSTALAGGAAPLPDRGPIAVFRPRADTDLSALAPDRVRAIQGFRPDHDALAARGYAVSATADGIGPCAAAVVLAPRARAEARALIAEASRLVGDGPVLVDGQKTDGIEGLLKACRVRTELGGAMSKAHGKLFWFAGGDFDDWAASARSNRIEGGYVTAPGTFSADAPDPGSVALANAFPERMPGEIADLGAGWGYLSRRALERDGVASIHLVEAEHAALACAKKNVKDPRARFHWADATRFEPTAPLDAVVANPPFHRGRAGDPDIGKVFIAKAAAILKRSGRLWLVANRHLPYKEALYANFAELAELPAPPAYKIYAAAKPRRKPR